MQIRGGQAMKTRLHIRYLFENLHPRGAMAHNSSIVPARINRTIIIIHKRREFVRLNASGAGQARRRWRKRRRRWRAVYARGWCIAYNPRCFQPARKRRDSNPAVIPLLRSLAPPFRFTPLPRYALDMLQKPREIRARARDVPRQIEK